MNTDKIVELLNEDEACIIAGPDGTRLLIPHMEDDDSLAPDHVTTLVTIAVLLKVDPEFYTYLENRWEDIKNGRLDGIPGYDEDDK